MMNLENKIVENITPLCAEEEIFLHKVHVHCKGKSLTIRIVADTVEGITLKQCKELSKKISDLMYRKDLLRQPYHLEVSSPGIEKPLNEVYEYRRNIGHDLKVDYHDKGSVTSIIGNLMDVDDEKIVLKIDEDEVNISYSKIQTAKIQLKW